MKKHSLFFVSLVVFVGLFADGLQGKNVHFLGMDMKFGVVEESTLTVQNPYCDRIMKVAIQPFSYTGQGYEGDFNRYTGKYAEWFWSGESVTEIGCLGAPITISPRRVIRSKEYIAIIVRWYDDEGALADTASIVVQPGYYRGAWHFTVSPWAGQYDRRFPADSIR